MSTKLYLSFIGCLNSSIVNMVYVLVGAAPFGKTRNESKQEIIRDISVCLPCVISCLQVGAPDIPPVCNTKGLSTSKCLLRNQMCMTKVKIKR